MSPTKHPVTDDDRRFFDNIPEYNDNDLSESERQWMEAYMERFPQARKQVEFERNLARGFRASIAAIPKDQGLEQVMSRIRAYEAQKASVKPTTSWIEKLTAMLGTTPGMAVAMSVVALQFAVILFMVGTGTDNADYVEHRGVESVAAIKASAKLNLRPDAPMGDVLALLREHSASLVAGPGASGEVWIALPGDASQALQAMRTLRESPLVEGVTPIQTAP